MKKKLTVVAALVLVLVIGVTGTLAYLTSTPGAITNTFTVGKVKIELTETANGNNNQFKMVPGDILDKNPTVTVKQGSEACYVYVKVEESIDTGKDFSDYIIYNVDTSTGEWTQLVDGDDTAVEGVYYREVAADAAADQSFHVIGYTKDGTFTQNKVLINEDLTNDMLTGDNKLEADPTLKFTAYAIQKANTGTPYEAWLEVSQ